MRNDFLMAAEMLRLVKSLDTPDNGVSYHYDPATFTVHVQMARGNVGYQFSKSAQAANAEWLYSNLLAGHRFIYNTIKAQKTNAMAARGERRRAEAKGPMQ